MYRTICGPKGGSEPKENTDNENGAGTKCEYAEIDLWCEFESTTSMCQQEC